ncbi:MAG: hypothetical protein HRT45_09430 [Bdellovibrionales bacterium]|nr:hypothetical protein [Bdellovibrionales bacterium]
MTRLRLILKQVNREFHLGVVLYLSVIFVGLVSFQNCSDPLELAEEDASTFSDKLPFAYDVKMDTFSYMSCADMTQTNYDRRALHTFHLGAYEPTSGVRLTQEFLDATGNFRPEARAEALSRSPTNTGAILQFAVRNTEVNHQQILLNDPNGRLVVVGEDIGNFLGGAPLSAPGVASALVKEEVERMEAEQAGDLNATLPYINYFKGSPGFDGRLMETKLRFPNTLKSITDQFYRSVNLSLTFTPENNVLSYFARSPNPENQAREVYGYKYIPTFNGLKRKHGANEQGSFSGNIQPSGSSIQNRTIVALREVNLLTNEGKSWFCEPDLRLVMIDPFDSRFFDATVGNEPCTISAAAGGVDDMGSIPSARDRKRLEIIRRVLRVEDFYVNIQENCVVPKDSKNSCYPKADADGNLTVDIKYGIGSSPPYYCNDNPSEGIYECANYVSICTRDPLPSGT